MLFFKWFILRWNTLIRAGLGWGFLALISMILLFPLDILNWNKDLGPQDPALISLFLFYPWLLQAWFTVRGIRKRVYSLCPICHYSFNSRTIWKRSATMKIFSVTSSTFASPCSTARPTLTPAEKHMLVKVMGFSLFLIDSEQVIIGPPSFLVSLTWPKLQHSEL